MDFFKFSDLLCDSYPYRITTWWLNLLYRQFEKWVVTVDGDWWENWRQNCWKIFICVYIFFHPEVRVVFDGNFRMHHFLQKCQEIFNDVDVLFTSEIFIIWIFRFQKPLKRYIQILPIFCNNARKIFSWKVELRLFLPVSPTKKDHKPTFFGQNISTENNYLFFNFPLIIFQAHNGMVLFSGNRRIECHWLYHFPCIRNATMWICQGSK